MKRIIIFLFAMLFLFSGCESEQEKEYSEIIIKAMTKYKTLIPNSKNFKIKKAEFYKPNESEDNSYNYIIYITFNYTDENNKSQNKKIYIKTNDQGEFSTLSLTKEDQDKIKKTWDKAEGLKYKINVDKLDNRIN